MERRHAPLSTTSGNVNLWLFFPPDHSYFNARLLLLRWGALTGYSNRLNQKTHLSSFGFGLPNVFFGSLHIPRRRTSCNIDAFDMVLFLFSRLEVDWENHHAFWWRKCKGSFTPFWLDSRDFGMKIRQLFPDSQFYNVKSDG